MKQFHEKATRWKSSPVAKWSLPSREVLFVCLFRLTADTQPYESNVEANFEFVANIDWNLSHATDLLVIRGKRWFLFIIQDLL